MKYTHKTNRCQQHHKGRNWSRAVFKLLTYKGIPHLCASGIRMVVDQIKNLLCFGV